MDAMPEGSEGKAQGIMTTAYHSGFFLGPVIGGIIIDYINWRSIFFFLVPFGLVGIGLSYARIRKSSEQITTRRVPSVDYVGMTLFIALTIILTLLLENKYTEFLGVWEKGLLTLAFAVTLWAFLTYETKASSPMMNLSLFKMGMFTYSIISLLVVSISRSFISLILPFYLQGVLHISPSFMGIMFLTPPLITIVLATLSGHITDRIGPRIPATVGVGMSIVAFLIGANLSIDSHWIVPILMLGFVGAAHGFFDSPNQAAIIGSVPKEHRGFATGMVHTAFGLGHILGFSISALILTLAFQHYSGIPDATPNPENTLAFLSSMNACYLAAVGLGLLALLTSLMRGHGKIQPVAAKPFR